MPVTPAERAPSARIGSALAVAAVHVAIGYALLSAGHVIPPLREADVPLLKIFEPARPDPPPDPEPVRTKPRVEPAGGTPPAPSREPITKPITPALPAPVPIIALPSPIAGGPAPSGPGGNGAGVGGAGGGSGVGIGTGSGGVVTPAEQIGGRFRNRDFPASAKQAGPLRTGVRYAVGPGGRVDSCTIIETSGYAEVDAMTCRVISERYRFRPARDETGHPITEVMEEDYRWNID